MDTVLCYSIVSQTHFKLCLKNLKERDNSDDEGVDGRTKLKQILRKNDARLYITFTWLRKVTNGEFVLIG
jgi:hypothetical protein